MRVNDIRTELFYYGVKPEKIFGTNRGMRQLAK